MKNILLTPDEVRALFREELQLFFSQHAAGYSRTKEEDHWFGLEDICNYMPDKPKPSTVYGWVRERKIPYHKKTKKLSFLKSEIDTWLKSGKKKTAKEIDMATDIFLQKRK